MDLGIQGKVALVAAASKVWARLCSGACQEGARVAILSRRQEVLDQVPQKSARRLRSPAI